MAVWAVLLAISTAGGGMIGYRVYLRSDFYRRGIEKKLACFFGLPIEVAQVEPHRFSARRLRGVQIWLPQRRARVFHCPQAIWETADEKVPKGTVIHVYQANLAINSDQWESGDYMRVLRASLVHNFKELNISQVRFHDAVITWLHKGFELRAGRVDGLVEFDGNSANGGGHAELTSYSLNGMTVNDPIRIQAELDPQNPQALIPQVSLTVNTMPVHVLGLDQLLQSRVTQGLFAGRIQIRQSQKSEEIEIDGFISDVRTDEFTRLMPGGVVSAVVDFKISHCLIRDRQLVSMSFDGEICELVIDSLLSRFGLPEMGGQVSLNVEHGHIENGLLQRLVASGQWQDGSLPVVSRLLLNGLSLEGKFDAKVNSLTIEENELVGGNIELTAAIPDGQTGQIETAVLLGIFKQRLGLTLPEMILPEKIEYVHMGARLIIDRQQVRLLSADGPAGPALITLQLYGQKIPLFGQVDKKFDIKPFLDKAKERTREKVSQFKDAAKP